MKNTEFISQEQHWMNYSDNIEREKRITVMSVDGKAHCNIHIYPMENVQILSTLYVEEDARNKGYAKAILDYIDNNRQERKYTMVYIREDSPEWLIKMYENRGYVIRTT